MNPPDQNPTYIKVDDSSFYYATTSSEFFNVEALKTEIANLQAQIDGRAKHLKAASDLGVEDAATAIAVLVDQPLSPFLKGAKADEIADTPQEDVKP